MATGEEERMAQERSDGGAGIDLLAHRIRPAAGEPEGALVLLHGRGTSEHDLHPLLDALDPDRRLVGVTPRGPLVLPPGGAHWYVVRRVGFPDPATFHPTYERLSAWVDALPAALGVPLGRTVIGGFSQGAVMSYAVGLGEGRPAPAGIMALSGFMPTVEDFALDLGGRAGFRAAVAHGSLDTIIPAELGRQAAQRLEAAGADLLWRETPVPHTVDPSVLAELRAWLGETLP